jgi:hypothetical protein
MTVDHTSTPPDPEDIVRARQRADATVNAALDWIERFHSDADPDVLVRLIDGIRPLVRAMQGRSTSGINERINGLLAIHARLRLPGAAATGRNAESIMDETRLAVPWRMHDDWAFSTYFSPDAHERRTAERRRGPVFVSYARADVAWLERLKIHLHPLVRAGKVDMWHDGKIDPGKNWVAAIREALNAASAAILLLSPDFMASDFIHTHELQPLAQRASWGGVVILPLMVGHCLFEEDDHLKQLQMFNDPEKPLSRLGPGEADEVLVSLAKAVLRLRNEEKRTS